MKTDTLWIAAFILGFLFSFAVLNSAPGIGLFLGVNSLVAALIYFGTKNREAKEIEETPSSIWLLRILTSFYVVLTIPYLYRLDYQIVAALVAFHALFLVVGALYFALPSMLHIVDIFSLILGPIVFAVTWVIEAIKSFFELFKENANVVRLLIKVILYSATSLLVFILFAKLLSAADAEFKTRIDTILESLDLIEVMRRTVIAVVMSFVSAGLLTLVGTAKVLPLFGLSVTRAKELWTKAFSVMMSKRSDALLPVIITAPVLFLFAMYVWVQFSYLFGRDVTEILSKYSFADYARRGFVELLVVGVLTYPLLAWSMSQAKSEWKIPRIASFLINTGIVSALIIMLYSLVVRMNLYMTAYGPSVLRMYVIVGAIFVGVALVAYEFLAVAKALKPGFAVFRGRLMTDYVIVAVLTGMGLLGAISLIPWNNVIANKILAEYEKTQKIDVFQVTKLPLESEALVYQLGKTLEADNLREAGLMLQAHAMQEVSTYKTQREDSIFTRIFGMNFASNSLYSAMNTTQSEEVMKKFRTAMNEKIFAIENNFLKGLESNNFSEAGARFYFDPEMKKNDIAGFAAGVSVIRKELPETLFDKITQQSYVDSFVYGTYTTNTYDLLDIIRVGEKPVETSITTTLGFRNAQVVMTDSSLILNYLPDAVSELGNTDLYMYGYRRFCKVPNLEVIYSDSLDCVNGLATDVRAKPIAPTDPSVYSPMGLFKKSDFVTVTQE